MPCTEFPVTGFEPEGGPFPAPILLLLDLGHEPLDGWFLRWSHALFLH